MVNGEFVERPGQRRHRGRIGRQRHPGALTVIDNALGIDITTPDHVFYVTPAGCCPATEPEVGPTAESRSRGSPGPCCDGTGTLVSVVDTGFIPGLDDALHSWLDGVTGDEEFIDPANIAPYVGHGTFVAGVLRCMAPGAEVRVEGFLTHGGAIFESEIVRQLNDAIDLMPDIISMSAGCTTRDNLVPLAFEALWENRLRHCKGTVLVAAAGNDDSRRQFFPAACEWAVSVGALDRRGNRAPFSNFGSWVDVYALGVDVVNAFPNGTYHYRDHPARRDSVPVRQRDGALERHLIRHPAGGRHDCGADVAHRAKRPQRRRLGVADRSCPFRAGRRAIAKPNMACGLDTAGSS